MSRSETLYPAAVILGSVLLLSWMLNRIYQRRVLGIGPVQRAMIGAAGAVAIVLFRGGGANDGWELVTAFARWVNVRLTEWMALDN